MLQIKLYNFGPFIENYQLHQINELFSTEIDEFAISVINKALNIDFSECIHTQITHFVNETFQDEIIAANNENEYVEVLVRMPTHSLFASMITKILIQNKIDVKFVAMQYDHYWERTNFHSIQE